MAYCSRGCQRRDYKSHNEICKAIQDAEKRVYANLRTMFECTLTPNEKTEVVKLVGKRCMIKCGLGGKDIEALWDSGSMVTLISERWLRKWFPNLKIFTLCFTKEGL